MSNKNKSGGIKRQFGKIGLALVFSCALVKGSAQSYEAKVLLLDVTKLTELKNILKDMKTGYQVLSKGYATVRDISEGSFKLHEVFLDGLWLVSPTVRHYWKIPEVIAMEVALVKTCHGTLAQFNRRGNLSAADIRYLREVYDGLIERSLRNVDDLTSLITDHAMRMSDAERLSGIDRIYEDLREKLSFLKDFNTRVTLLDLQKKEARDDARTLSQLNE